MANKKLDQHWEKGFHFGNYIHLPMLSQSVPDVVGSTMTSNGEPLKAWGWVNIEPYNLCKPGSSLIDEFWKEQNKLYKLCK